MIRDAVALEREGVPTVALVHDKFVPAAKAQARVLGMPGLLIAPVPQPMPWETPEDERRKAEDSIGPIVSMLSEARPAEAR